MDPAGDRAGPRPRSRPGRGLRTHPRRLDLRGATLPHRTRRQVPGHRPRPQDVARAHERFAQVRSARARADDSLRPGASARFPRYGPFQKVRNWGQTRTFPYRTIPVGSTKLFDHASVVLIAKKPKSRVASASRLSLIMQKWKHKRPHGNLRNLWLQAPETDRIVSRARDSHDRAKCAAPSHRAFSLSVVQLLR